MLGLAGAAVFLASRKKKKRRSSSSKPNGEPVVEGEESIDVDLFEEWEEEGMTGVG